MSQKKIKGLIVLALCFSCMGTEVCMAQETADSFVADMESLYADPEMQYKPYARWWLAEGSHTDETLKESIQELYDAGYGGVEFVTLNESQYLDNDTYAWGSDEWIHDSQLIIEECAKLGMSVSMTSGTHWSTANLVSITPDEEAASQELGYTTVTVENKGDGSNTCYKGYLPYCELPAHATEQSLVRVVAARTVESDGDTVKLDFSSTTDITDLAVDVSGKGIYGIDYTAPDDSEYVIFSFYQYGTGESCSPAISNSYTINYLSTEGANALIDYWDGNILTEEMQSIINQLDECDLYMDSLELSVHGSNTTGMLWCADMLDQFSERNTYDIDALLPFLIQTGGTFGAELTYYYEPADEEDQKYVDNMRTDFLQTQTELYTENCLQILADWLHSKNMKLRAENSYGQTFEISEPATALDYIETESMEFANELDSYRGMAGAAHLLNKRMSSETGAWVSSNYVYNNEYYRQIFYLQYAAGIQKTVTHGYSADYGPEEYVQWPGFEGMDAVWSERFNKRQPASVDYAELNLHLSRIQKVLEAGVSQMDLAIMRTDYAYNNSLTPGGLMNFVKNGVYSNKTHNQDAYYWRDLELQNAGYTYDYFSPYLLNAEGVSSSDGVINADGVSYQALILMEEELPLESAQTILEWAENGLPVVFVNNTSEMIANEEILKENTVAGSTTASNNTDDSKLKEIVDRIKALDNVRTVESEADAYEALTDLGVYPRAEYVESNENLLSVMRRSDEADYLYLYNYMYEDEENYQGQVSLDGIYRPYILDTWSGKVCEAENYEISEGRTIVDVDLDPGETMVFILRKDTNLADGDKVTGSTDTEEIEIGNWNLIVDSYEPGEKVTRTEENPDTGVTTTEAAYTTEHDLIEVGVLGSLKPWKELKKVGETVSGIGTYTSAFELTEDQISESTKIRFCADSFEGGTAALWVNDQQVPVNMDSCQADITDYVISGENTITVRVTSSLRNKMIEQGYEQGWNLNTPEPDSYGMTGDTVLLLEKKQ